MRRECIFDGQKGGWGSIITNISFPVLMDYNLECVGERGCIKNIEHKYLINRSYLYVLRFILNGLMDQDIVKSTHPIILAASVYRFNYTPDIKTSDGYNTDTVYPSTP